LIWSKRGKFYEEWRKDKRRSRASLWYYDFTSHFGRVLGAIVSLGFIKTLPLSFGGAIATLARLEGNPSRISLRVSVW
jgi:hypothetical protein